MKDFENFKHSKYLKHPKKNAGFSLIETIVYTAIFVVISVAVMDALLNISKLLIRARAEAGVRASGSLAMERLVREIQTASFVATSSSVLGVSPGELELNSTDENGAEKVVRFTFLADSQGIGLLDGGQDKGSITGKNTPVARLVFSYGTTTKSSFVKIEMTLASAKFPLLTAEKFYGTVVLRGK